MPHVVVSNYTLSQLLHQPGYLVPLTLYPNPNIKKADGKDKLRMLKLPTV